MIEIQIFSYDTEEEFNTIVKFMSLSKNMANKCYKNVKDRPGVKSVDINLAISDIETEGVFVNYYTKNTVAYLPLVGLPLMDELWSSISWK